MWKNFGKTKILTSFMLLVGLGVATGVAINTGNKPEDSGGSTVVEGETDDTDSTKKAEGTRVEPKGVTEVSGNEETGDNSGSDGASTSWGIGDVSLSSVDLAVADTNMTNNDVAKVVTSDIVGNDNVEVAVSSVVNDNSAGIVIDSVTNDDSVEVIAKSEPVEEKRTEDITSVEGNDGLVDGYQVSVLEAERTDEGEVSVTDAEVVEVEKTDEVDAVVGGEIGEEASGDGVSKADVSKADDTDTLTDEEAEALEAARQAELEKQAGEQQGTSIIADTYYWRNDCPGNRDTYLTAVNGYYVGGYVCECVSYVAWKAYEAYGLYLSWGHAYSWDDNARNAGYQVDNTPEAKSIGQIDGYPYGHTFWVESVNEDGSINVTEYNNAWSTYLYSGDMHYYDFGVQTIPVSEVGNYNYIHLRKIN